MKTKILITLIMAVALIGAYNLVDGYAALTPGSAKVTLEYSGGTYDGSQPIFGQLKNQFLVRGQLATIPIGASSLLPEGKVEILREIGGLTDAHLEPVGDNLGQHAVANLYWAPQFKGQYTCTITAVERNTGAYTTATFTVYVEDEINITSPTINPIGTQIVPRGTMLTIPVSAHRAHNPYQGELNINAIGLLPEIHIENLVKTPTDLTCNLIWYAEVEGNYLLQIQVSDEQGLAYSVLQVPVKVTPPDNTPPTTPVVRDEGKYTTKRDQLYADWISIDRESGIAEYKYRITEDSPNGRIIRFWTSTKYNYVTAGGLPLIEGKKYYFGVQAKNGAGLWSATGYSDGIESRVTHKAAIKVTYPPDSVRIKLGKPITIKVEVTNKGGIVWIASSPENKNVFRCRTHGYLPDGTFIRDLFGYGYDLSRNIAPDETVALKLTIPTGKNTKLNKRGKYQIGVDMVQEGVKWFKNEVKVNVALIE